ncbi:hypothetical protein [Lachnoclostridium sp.]|nr:hypothetical protein [Lachnoclostridium sp.]
MPEARKQESDTRSNRTRIRYQKEESRNRLTFRKLIDILTNGNEVLPWL